ncbi:unnamed protein product, partial [Closterium sp. NIES-64]
HGAFLRAAANAGHLLWRLLLGVPNFSAKEVSLLLEALLRTSSRTLLKHIIATNGLNVLQILGRKLQHERERVAILRKLLRVAHHLHATAALSLQAAHAVPPTANERDAELLCAHWPAAQAQGRGASATGPATSHPTAPSSAAADSATAAAAAAAAAASMPLLAHTLRHLQSLPHLQTLPHLQSLSLPLSMNLALGGKPGHGHGHGISTPGASCLSPLPAAAHPSHFSAATTAAAAAAVQHMMQRRLSLALSHAVSQANAAAAAAATSLAAKPPAPFQPHAPPLPPLPRLLLPFPLPPLLCHMLFHPLQLLSSSPPRAGSTWHGAVAHAAALGGRQRAAAAEAAHGRRVVEGMGGTWREDAQVAGAQAVRGGVAGGEAAGGEAAWGGEAHGEGGVTAGMGAGSRAVVAAAWAGGAGGLAAVPECEAAAPRAAPVPPRPLFKWVVKEIPVHADLHVDGHADVHADGCSDTHGAVHGDVQAGEAGAVVNGGVRDNGVGSGGMGGGAIGGAGMGGAGMGGAGMGGAGMGGAGMGGAGMGGAGMGGAGMGGAGMGSGERTLEGMRSQGRWQGEPWRTHRQRCHGLCSTAGWWPAARDHAMLAAAGGAREEEKAASHGPDPVRGAPAANGTIDTAHTVDMTGKPKDSTDVTSGLIDVKVECTDVTPGFTDIGSQYTDMPKGSTDVTPGVSDVKVEFTDVAPDLTDIGPQYTDMTLDLTDTKPELIDMELVSDELTNIALTSADVKPIAAADVEPVAAELEPIVADLKPMAADLAVQKAVPRGTADMAGRAYSAAGDATQREHSLTDMTRSLLQQHMAPVVEAKAEVVALRGQGWQSCPAVDPPLSRVQQKGAELEEHRRQCLQGQPQQQQLVEQPREEEEQEKQKVRVRGGRVKEECGRGRGQAWMARGRGGQREGGLPGANCHGVVAAVHREAKLGAAEEGKREVVEGGGRDALQGEEQGPVAGEGWRGLEKGVGDVVGLQRGTGRCGRHEGRFGGPKEGFGRREGRFGRREGRCRGREGRFGSHEGRFGRREGGSADAKGGVADAKGGLADMKGGSVDAKGGSADAKGGVADEKGGSADVKGGLADAKGGSADVKGGLADVKGGLAEARGRKSLTIASSLALILPYAPPTPPLPSPPSRLPSLPLSSPPTHRPPPPCMAPPRAPSLPPLGRPLPLLSRPPRPHLAPHSSLNGTCVSSPADAPPAAADAPSFPTAHASPFACRQVVQQQGKQQEGVCHSGRARGNGWQSEGHRRQGDGHWPSKGHGRQSEGHRRQGEEHEIQQQHMQAHEWQHHQQQQQQQQHQQQQQPQQQHNGAHRLSSSSSAGVSAGAAARFSCNWHVDAPLPRAHLSSPAPLRPVSSPPPPATAADGLPYALPHAADGLPYALPHAASPSVRPAPGATCPSLSNNPPSNPHDSALPSAVTPLSFRPCLLTPPSSPPSSPSCLSSTISSPTPSPPFLLPPSPRHLPPFQLHPLQASPSVARLPAGQGGGAQWMKGEGEGTWRVGEGAGGAGVQGGEVGGTGVPSCGEARREQVGTEEVGNGEAGYEEDMEEEEEDMDVDMDLSDLDLLSLPFCPATTWAGSRGGCSRGSRWAGAGGLEQVGWEQVGWEQVGQQQMVWQQVWQQVGRHGVKKWKEEMGGVGGKEVGEKGRAAGTAEGAEPAWHRGWHQGAAWQGDGGGVTPLCREFEAAPSRAPSLLCFPSSPPLPSSPFPHTPSPRILSPSPVCSCPGREVERMRGRLVREVVGKEAVKSRQRTHQLLYPSTLSVRTRAAVRVPAGRAAGGMSAMSDNVGQYGRIGTVPPLCYLSLLHIPPLLTPLLLTIVCLSPHPPNPIALPCCVAEFPYTPEPAASRGSGGAGSSLPPPPVGIWGVFSVAFYRPFFDVDTADVAERVRDALMPFPRSSFLEKTALNPDIRACEESGVNPDIYGPFWICTTLVFLLAQGRRAAVCETPIYGPFWICTTLVFLSASLGNLASYLSYAASPSSAAEEHWHYNIDAVSWAAAIFYGYVAVVPLLLFFLLRYLQFITVLPLDLLRWLIVLGATAISCFFLGVNLRAQITVGHEMWFPIVVGAVLLQAGLGVLLKLYSSPTFSSRPRS